MKDRMELDRVVLLGRTFAEYCAFFQLTAEDLQGRRVLDAGAGISSFCAEARARGYDVTAADPIYALPVEVLADKSETDWIKVLKQLPGVAHNYNWTFYRNLEELDRYRKTARELFINDYGSGRNHYAVSSLPATGFADNAFDLALVSHFLFLYDDLFSYDFHKQSLLDLARIAREIRIYPLANLAAVQSSFLESLMRDPECAAVEFSTCPGEFEFLKNSNELLIVRGYTYRSSK